MNDRIKYIRPPILSVFAWTSVALLLVGWGCLLPVFGGAGGLHMKVFVCTHFAAFVVGLFSLGRLGNIAALLAALTLTGWVAWASALYGVG